MYSYLLCNSNWLLASDGFLTLFAARPFDYDCKLPCDYTKYKIECRGTTNDYTYKALFPEEDSEEEDTFKVIIRMFFSYFCPFILFFFQAATLAPNGRGDRGPAADL